MRKGKATAAERQARIDAIQKDVQELRQAMKPDTWKQFCRGYAALLFNVPGWQVDRAVYAGISISFPSDVIMGVEAVARETAEFKEVRQHWRP